MVQSAVKRHADPQMVLGLWNGCVSIKQQKQIPNAEKLKSFMTREYGIKETESSRQIQNAVQDGLLKALNKSKGTDNEGLCMPDLEDCAERDSHDWYCFDCHQSGEVIECSDCWRVFHTTCAEEDSSGDTFTCSVCVAVKSQPKVKRKELNKMLGFTVRTLKHKAKEFIRFDRKEEEMRFDQLAFRDMDLSTIENKAKERKYRSLEQFYSDTRIILHNVFICYGDNSSFGALAKWMIRDCKYDLDEIRQCKNCYYYSNAKPKEWFAQPCRPAHDLVYAKLKGFSYWPAKVIKVTKEGYDVRFFGGLHQRAIVAESAVKPIDVSVKSLAVKRTSGFVKASEELKKHQDLLRDMDDDDERELIIDEEKSDQEGETEADDEPPIKHKKFRKRQREEEVSSSSVSHANASAEDLVTSTEGHTPKRSKKRKSKSGGTPGGEASSGTPSSTTTCNCGINVQQALSSLRTELESKHRQDKTKALREKEHQLKKEHELERSEAQSRNASNLQRELEKCKRQTEDKCKEVYMEEMKKLAQKHKQEISQAKKKQWCYNCDEEAMYHCCWNTSYCSTKCQQDHWHSEHRRMCRRKR